MTQTFNEDVIVNGDLEVNGTQDTTQVTVKGHTTQTEPLQSWQDNSGNVQAQMSGDGRFLIGDDLGMATDDALIEAHRDAASSLPKRGLNTLGRISSALSDAVQWVVAELELSGGVTNTDVQTSLRTVVTHNNDEGSSQELRAGEFEVINQAGDVTKSIGVRAAISNEAEGTITDAIGLEVQFDDEGTITNAYGVKVNDVNQGTSNFALHTGAGIVHLGDVVELEAQMSDPPSPSGNQVLLFPKPDGKLYAKNSAVEYDLTGGAYDIGDLKLSWRKTDQANRWLRCDGRTIGSVGSGATARSDADIEELFIHLWDNSNNSELPIQDGSGSPTTRGASAAADYAANKRMPLPDLRGRVAAMLDDPTGSSAANRMTASWADNLGGSGGTETHTLTVAEMPSHTHTQNAHNHGISDPGHNHSQNAHNHTQNAHNHGISDPGHNHSQNAHNHSQNAHNHGVTDPGHSHAMPNGYGTVVGGTTHRIYWGPLNLISGLLTGSNSTGISVNNATATNNATTATNNASTTGIGVNNATATNQAATATNIANTTGIGVNNATATNQNTGNGQAHNNVQPTMSAGIYLIYTGN